MENYYHLNSSRLHFRKPGILLTSKFNSSYSSDSGESNRSNQTLSGTNRSPWAPDARMWCRRGRGARASRRWCPAGVLRRAARPACGSRASRTAPGCRAPRPSRALASSLQMHVYKYCRVQQTQEYDATREQSRASENEHRTTNEEKTSSSYTSTSCTYLRRGRASDCVRAELWRVPRRASPLAPTECTPRAPGARPTPRMAWRGRRRSRVRGGRSHWPETRDDRRNAKFCMQKNLYILFVV